MGKINISGNIKGDSVQIGHQNIIYTTNSLSGYEKELLTIFNKYCTSDSEKEELINDLNKIENEGLTKASASASNILTFLNSIGAGLVSSGIFEALHKL